MKGFHVRRRTRWVVMSLLITVAGCGGDSSTNMGDDDDGNGNGGGGPTVTTSVSVGDNFFDPSSNAVSPGATVTWTWAGSRGHNVTFASGAVSAPSNTQTNGTFQVVMPTATGVYGYSCTIHSGMDGAVTVQ